MTTELAEKDATHEVIPEGSNFKLTKTGLSIQAAIPEDQFVALGVQIGSMHRASMFFIGDWLNHAKAHFPNRYETAGEMFGLETGTLYNAASVAAKVEISRRRENLTFEHHAAVAKLPSAEQETWISAADSNKLTRQELRSSIAAGRVIRFVEKKPDPRDKGQGGVLSVINDFNYEVRKAKDKYGENLDKWPSNIRRTWLESLRPVTAFITELTKAEK